MAPEELEAAVRGLALLARIRDRGDGERSGNLPWVYAALLQALAMTGRTEEARALVPAAIRACQRLRTPLLQTALALLAAAEGRFEDAARWVGHTRAPHARLGLEVERDDARTLDRVAGRAAEVLGTARASALESEGQALDDAAVAALARRAG